MSEKEKKPENGLEKKIKESEKRRDEAKDKKIKEFYEFAIQRYKELNNNY